MKRLQLFEFTDLPWWPNVLRNLLTDFLEFLMAVTKPFSPMAILLAKIMDETRQTQFVDLCSGSGGPWKILNNVLQKVSEKEISIILTDKYPNNEITKKLVTTPNIIYYPHSVDALTVPGNLEGIRTLFNGFHHFPPNAAAAILNDAVKCNQPIVIFEILQRSWFDFFCFMLTPINLLLLTPWIRPRTFKRFLLTYLIPIAPIAALWDSVISILRCYTPKELLAMAHQVDNTERYTWKAGCYRHNGLPVTYLIGYPIIGKQRN